MKYKVGDKVVLRDDLEDGREYGGLEYWDTMDRPSRKPILITIVDPRDNTYATEYGCWISQEMIAHEKTARFKREGKQLKDKKWLLEVLDRMEFYESKGGKRSKFEVISEIEEAVKQLDQPELPVIPDYVVEDYERMQGYSGADLAALNYWTRNSGLQCSEKSYMWLLDQDMETIASLLNGRFNVKEKKYEVRLPVSPLMDFEYALLGSGGNIWLDAHPPRASLTEKEIKAIDERYWAFKEEVTD